MNFLISLTELSGKHSWIWQHIDPLPSDFYQDNVTKSNVTFWQTMRSYVPRECNIVKILERNTQHVFIINPVL